MKAFKLAAASAVVILAGLGVFLVRDAQQPPTVVTPATPAPAAAAAGAVAGEADAPPSTPCTFTEGDRFAYALSASTSWRLPESLRAAVGDRADGTSSWSAELHFEVLSAEPKGAVLLARLVDASGEQGNVDGVDAAWLARVDRRCGLAGFARHTATLPPAARAQQTALSELNFTVPDADSVAIDFLNGTGHARGEVVRDGELLVRHVKSYPQVWSRDMEGIALSASALTVRRGASGWFDSMQGLERFSASSLENGRVELSVVSIAPRPGVLDGASRRLEDYVWGDALGPIQPQTSAYVPADYQERVAAMRDVQFDTALERFTVTADTEHNVATQWPAMAAFLDAHPEDIDAFATLLVADFEPQWKAGGFLALGQTQHPAAREALLDIWRERGLPMMDRVRSSLALSTRADVGVAFAQELRAEVTRTPSSPDEANVARQALLHLGVLAGTRPTNREVAEVVRDTVRSKLGRTATPHELAATFAAIGNTGDVSFLPELENWSQHADPEVRATVAIGMRRMPVEQVEAFTVAWLKRETHPDVKREIFEVVHHQYTDAGRPVGPALLAEAVKHLRQQPRILTRQSLFRILEPHVATSEEARQVMREQLAVEYQNHSGLFAFVASVLGERDVQSVLAGLPSLRDQFNGVPTTPPSTPSMADAVNDTTVPDGLMPTPPTATDLEIPAP